MDTKLVTKLETMKKRITEIQEAKTKLEGKIEQLTSDLQKYGVATVKEANTKLDKMDIELSGMEELFNAKIIKLSDDYDWG